MPEKKDEFDDMHTSRSQRFFNLGGALSVLIRAASDIIQNATDFESALTSLWDDDYGEKHADAIEIIEDEVSTELVQLADALEGLCRDGLNTLKILDNTHEGTGKKVIIATVTKRIEELFGYAAGTGTLPILAADAKKANIHEGKQGDMFDGNTRERHYCVDCGQGYEAEWEARTCTCIWKDQVRRVGYMHGYDDDYWEAKARREQEEEIKKHLEGVKYYRTYQGYEIADGIQAIEAAESEEVEDAENDSVDEGVQIGRTN